MILTQALHQASANVKFNISTVNTRFITAGFIYKKSILILTKRTINPFSSAQSINSF